MISDGFFLPVEIIIQILEALIPATFLHTNAKRYKEHQTNIARFCAISHVFRQVGMSFLYKTPLFYDRANYQRFLKCINEQTSKLVGTIHLSNLTYISLSELRLLKDVGLTKFKHLDIENCEQITGISTH